MDKALRKISEDLVTMIRGISQAEFRAMLEMKDYHGFMKSRFPHSILKKILEPYSLNPEEIQIELVEVHTDLSHENHIHKEAHAVTTILGELEHVDNPQHASAFKMDSWFPVSTGDQLDFPPHTPHTFTVKPGGILYFLSVQAPPIERDDGHDDYFRVSESVHLSNDRRGR